MLCKSRVHLQKQVFPFSFLFLNNILVFIFVFCGLFWKNKHRLCIFTANSPAKRTLNTGSIPFYLKLHFTLYTLKKLLPKKQ